MAYKETQPNAAGTPSDLGEYTFNCVFDDSPTLGQFARASMSKDGQTVYKTVSLPNNSQIQGYSIEANDTEATIYAVIKIPIGDGERTSGLVDVPVPYGSAVEYTQQTLYRPRVTQNAIEGCVITGLMSSPTYTQLKFVNATAEQRDGFLSFTYANKTVYYQVGTLSVWTSAAEWNPIPGLIWGSIADVAWTMIYGIPSGDEYETKEIMVGRFAIDLEDAGGVGPGSDWVDPGDYDPDWEEGDPTHTLYVTVTGALSGRHNDPVEDPSYSYIPADKDTIKDYGCGGDGGHGGGGGAGASTVVVHKFATNQANSKEVTAIARRHGYGSGGGKGGKGGDGCILVYY